MEVWTGMISPAMVGDISSSNKIPLRQKLHLEYIACRLFRLEHQE